MIRLGRRKRADGHESKTAKVAAPAEMELVADEACETGENPLWNEAEQRLYWTDIPAGKLHWYEPASATHRQCYAGRPVGGFTLQADGGLLLFMDRGTVAHLQNGTLSEVIPDIAEARASRFNDVIADPEGRVFCGTMSTDVAKGKLYRLDPDGSLHVLLEGIGCSNGMAFTLDQTGFYYTDSFAGTIYLFDYDAASGAITSQRIFAHFDKGEGMPDGISVDAEGHLWTALWDGGRVVRLRPDGAVDRSIKVPARKASSLTFGGPGLQDLYVTTAGGNKRSEEGALAGSLFRARPGVSGVPAFFSRVQHAPAASATSALPPPSSHPKGQS